VKKTLFKCEENIISVKKTLMFFSHFALTPFFFAVKIELKCEENIISVKKTLQGEVMNNVFFTLMGRD